MNKRLAILEAFAIFVGLIVYSILVVVPDMKAKLGSSDNFVSSGHYQNMIEIRIDQKTDFGLLLNEEGKVFHIFFFDNSSVFLYNKNIENHNLKDSLIKVVQILGQEGILKDTSKIEVTRYGEEFYSDFIHSWEDISHVYSIPKEILEKENNLDQKSLELGLEPGSLSAILLNMDFYSKEMVKNYKPLKIEE